MTRNLSHVTTDPTCTQAVLRTLCYYALFSYPLSSDEVWSSLDRAGISGHQVKAALHSLHQQGVICHSADEDWYWLPGPTAPVASRHQANARAQRDLPAALKVGRTVMALPFVEAVAISGSLSKGVQGEDDDFDFFIITSPGRLWIARTLITLYARLLPSRSWLCSNYIIDKSAQILERRDPFTALELATLIPVEGHACLSEMQRLNTWTTDYLPNMQPVPPAAKPRPPLARRLAEIMLPGPVGTLADLFFLGLSRLWFHGRTANEEDLRADNSFALNRHVWKLHSSQWKHRALNAFQKNISDLEHRHGMTIGRNTIAGRVLVASAYFYRFDAKQWQMGQPYPPLGTLYAAAVARQAGFDVSVFDAGLAVNEQDFLQHLERQRPEIVVLQEDGFNYLTKMCLSRMRTAALRMVGFAHIFGAKIVVASSDATDNPGIYLDAGADVVVLGESEETLQAILAAWRDQQPTTGIPGIAYTDPDSGTVQRPGQWRPIRDLDALPAPAWDLIDLTPYRTLWTRRHGRFSLNVATTRGCPYACNWCAKPLYGKRYSTRSPEHVVDELALLNQQYGAEHFWITDDIFGLKPGWVEAFNALIRSRGLSIRYTIQTRADLLLRDEGTLDALAESGLETAWIGAESGSQSILDAMNKGITRQEIDRVVPALRKKGIRSALFLQFGYLGETRADIDQTISMVTGLLPDQIGISVSYPLPGTPFYHQVKEALGQKTNWVDSDDLDLMFPGTYSPAFYKRLHRYMHFRFAVARAWAVVRGDIPARHRGGRLRGLASLARNLPRLGLEYLRLQPLQKPVHEQPGTGPQ